MRFPARFSGKSWLKIISALALGCLLAGCGTMKLAYNQAPELLYLYIDRYFDFNSAQSTQVKAELNKLQAWHRQTQLPVYAETLQKLQPQIKTDFSAKQACDVLADVRSKLQVITRQVEPAGALVAVTFGEAQFRQMEKKFARDNAKFREEYITATPQKVRAKRLKDAIERAERLYGSIGDKQIAMLGQIIDRSRFDPALALQERERRQQETLRALKSLNAAGAADESAQQKNRQLVRDLLAQTFESPDARYRSYAGTIAQEGCDGFADFHNVTTAEQRSRALETLQNYERDFRQLASQGQG
jgi:Family of unknown function (DUF6279)